MPVFLRLQGLRRAAEAALRRLLRVLFLWLDAMSTGSRERARDDEDCCGLAQGRSRKDWLGNARASLLAWWLPQAAVIAGLVVTVPVRTAVWVGALVWMGAACLFNARRSGRTHCWITGPYYIAMVGPVLALGTGTVAAGLYAWIACALLILVGDKIIWWATERAWGIYS